MLAALILLRISKQRTAMNNIDNTELEEELEKWRLSADKVEDRMPSERLG